MWEPTTVLTDSVLAAVALVLAWRLWRAGSAPARLWAAAFALLGLAALLGAAWHGLRPEVLPALRRWLWSFAYLAIGVANLAMAAGAARAALARRPALLLIALLAAGFGVCTVLGVLHQAFRCAAYGYAFTMALLLAFGIDLARRREPAARFVIAGVLVSLAGGVVEGLGLAPHPRFNDNDVFHLAQMAGLWLFQRAGLVLRSR